MIGNKVKKIFRKFFKKEDSLKEKGIKYIAEHYGAEYIDEFIKDYDTLNEGGTIGGLTETIAFLNLIEEIKKS